MVKELIFTEWAVVSEWLREWLLYGPEPWRDPPFILPKFKII
jgi:hypothetical protein